jgi:exodeoxyribonuclease V alpha subunit
VNDRTHGQQFRARFLKTSAPTSIEGIEKYLGSGMIRGIGPAYAKKLVRAFSEKVFDVIEAEPDRLREVDGIGPVRAKRIVDAWAEQKVVREIMMFLHSNGVGTARAVRIYKTYGADAVQVMTENPYRLTRDVRGIGFKTADAIAMRLGFEKTAMIRLRAGVSFALFRACRRSRDCGFTDSRAREGPHPQTLRPRPHPRRPGPLSNESGRRWGPLAQHPAPGHPEPRRRAESRAFRLDFRSRRQGHADRE